MRSIEIVPAVREVGILLPHARVVPASWHGIKRAIDVTIAGSVLLLTAPVLALASLAIVAVSPGPAVFRQDRVGFAGRRFSMFKLRTMHVGAHLMHEQMRELSCVDGPVMKIRNDPRLHALGKFLRRTSLDELPNLVNVLRGEMSIVGPRPPLPSEVAHYDARARRRLTVKPGVTCLWQVRGRSNLSFDEWMRLDTEYVEHWTPLGDLAIVLETIPAVLRGEGAH